MINKYNSFRRVLIPESTNITISQKKISTITTSASTFLTAFKTVAQAKLQALQVSQIAANLPAVQISRKKDIKLNVPNLIQGHNECGNTSLAMIERYFGVVPPDYNYHDMFYSDTVGHGPLALRGKAQGKGLTVRQENNGTLEDLTRLIDLGIPAQVLGIYGGGSNSSLSDYIDNASRAHWMVVTGYKRDDNGTITHIYFNNPNSSTTQCWTASAFTDNFWKNNIIPGGHRYYMAMAPRGSYQEQALNRLLPRDAMEDWFRDMLKVIDGMEDAFYAAEKAADTVADTAEDVWDTISGWFS